MFHLGKPNLSIQLTCRKAEPRRDEKANGKRRREEKERE